MTKQQLHSLTEKHVPVAGSVKFICYNSCAALCRDITIYKTTLYKSAKEGECVTVLQKTSGLKCNDGFLARGYLPANIKVTKTLNLSNTFKENCPDVRNTKTMDVIHQLQNFGPQVTIYDPLAKPDEVMHEYNLNTNTQLPETKIDAIILTAIHNEFLNFNLKSMLNPMVVYMM